MSETLGSYVSKKVKGIPAEERGDLNALVTQLTRGLSASLSYGQDSELGKKLFAGKSGEERLRDIRNAVQVALSTPKT